MQNPANDESESAFLLFSFFFFLFFLFLFFAVCIGKKKFLKVKHILTSYT